MTDSSMNTRSADALDIGSAADLFGDLGESPPGDDGVGGGSVDDERGRADDPRADDVEDRTASAVFGQLQDSVPDGGSVDDVLEDESPEDIIASADEPAREHDPIDDDLLADTEALEELLLTDRTEGEEFLWIETDATDDDPSSSQPPDTVTTDEDGSTGLLGRFRSKIRNLL